MLTSTLPGSLRRRPGCEIQVPRTRANRQLHRQRRAPMRRAGTGSCRRSLYDRQLPRARQPQLGHRISHRRPKRRDTRLADACRLLRRFDDLDFDLWHFIDSKGTIAVEIPGDRLAIVKRLFGVENMTEGEADTTFHLSADDVGIDGDPAIHRAPHFMYNRTFLTHRQFDDLRNLRVEAFDNGHAAGVAGLQLGILPVGKRGDGPQHAGMAALLAHQSQPAFHRVLSGGLKKLIDKGLDRVAGMGMSDRAPPQYGDADVNLVEVAFEVGNVVGNFARSFVGGGIQPILEGHRCEWRALHDRLSDDSIGPALNLAVADHAAHAVDAERAVVAAAHVIFTGPDQFHWLARTDGF